jgi:hypothetical protein
MGKRSDFPRLPQDQYDTPAAAVGPLLEHLAPCTRFIEPCAGAGCLVGHLKRAGHVLVGAYDLPNDARSVRYPGIGDGVVFVTNPPWSRPALHPRPGEVDSGFAVHRQGQLLLASIRSFAIR